MSINPYDMSLSPYDVERLRVARSVVLRQHNGVASITCRGTLAAGSNPVSHLVGALRTREHEIPVHAGVEPYAPRRRWRRERPLEFAIDAARLDPAWADAVRALAPGHRVALAWNHDQATGRLNCDAVQLTVTTPYGAHSSFTLASGPEWERAQPRRRRSRRRVRPVRTAMALLALWFVASYSMVLAAVSAAVILSLLTVSRWARGGGRGGGRARLWALSVVGALFTWLPVLGVGALGLWLLVRHRRSVRRVVRSLFGRRRAKRTGPPAPLWADSGPFTLSSAPHPNGKANGNGNGPYAGFADQAHISDSDRALLEHFAKHVGNVARMLDALAPGWQYRVDPSRLDPSDPADHLLEAAFNGDYDAGLDALMELCRSEGHPERQQCVRASLWNEACDELPQTTDHLHNAVLTRLWQQSVLQRRSTHQPA